MSRHGAIDLPWADGDHSFRLGLAEIEELEAKRDLSIFEIARRLGPERRTARLADIMQVIRVGLIGGGAKPVDALALVRRYVDERPLDESRDLAYAIVLAGMARVHATGAGDEEQPSGEAQAAKSDASTSPPSAEAQP